MLILFSPKIFSFGLMKFISSRKKCDIENINLLSLSRNLYEILIPLP